MDFETELLDLNPPNRGQNKKQCPAIRLTTNLKGWLEHWAGDRPLSYDRKSEDGKLERVAALDLPPSADIDLLRVTSHGFRAWRGRPIGQRQRYDRVLLAHFR